jgi:hypothetical protein
VRYVRLIAASSAGLAVLAAAANARAAPTFDDPYDVPDAPRPPTLPELTHPDIEATLETTAGALVPNPGGVITHAYVQRIGLEVPLGLRRWFVGAAYDVAAGTAGGAFKVVSGNVALTGRSLWATRTGLAFGGGTDVMLPSAAYDEGSPAALVAQSAATLRPWDVSYFVPNAFGVRPFVDVRAIDGRFVAQFRQGLDVMASTASLGERRVFATTGVYLGWRLSREVAAGLEAFETNAIDVPGVRDGARATVLVSPNVRLSLPWVQPAISAFTSVGTPLYGQAANVWGFRIAITLVYDASAQRVHGLETRPY